jgi:hypothetical protein
MEQVQGADNLEGGGGVSVTGSEWPSSVPTPANQRKGPLPAFFLLKMETDRVSKRSVFGTPRSESPETLQYHEHNIFQVTKSR